MEIRHLAHSEINRQKWDDCILYACNSLVYAESWYLDMAAPHWEALVGGDYEYVMPLPVKKKLGIAFLVQPPLTQQLGVFSSHHIDENIMEHFVQKIPYRSFHLCFNEQNVYSKGIKQPNYFLNLNQDYDTIFSAYSTNTKRNLKKAYSYNIEIKTDITANDFLEFFHATEKNYSEPTEKVNRLVRESLERKKLTVYGAYNTDNEIIAALCLLHSPQRLIYWLPVSNQEGKEALAMFRIVDEIIKNNANCHSLLDFYGSTIKTIARFYENFGADLNFYYEVKHLSINDFIKRFCFWK
jgi:hypothetical protein